MIFTPKPANTFPEFIDTYYDRCRERVPEIEANAGKWAFEDLIPGLSDFDTRFMVRNGMTPDDWCRMSTEVGRVHLELAQERKDWARNLEHLPGVNLQWNELLDPAQYFPEFAKWSFYRGAPESLQRVHEHIAARAWGATDEVYHWKIISLYYGPYDRAIDPPINLGAFENKYPLHSRLMHYLAPPLHSAVCLMNRKTLPGKQDAFNMARSLFPNAETIDEVFAILQRHYECPELMSEPGVTRLDERLALYLFDAIEVLRARFGLDCPSRPNPEELRRSVRGMKSGSPLAQLFESAKFARLMKGRLWFYGQNVLWFDSHWLIENELRRMRTNFYESPLRLFARYVLGTEATPETALAQLEGDVLSAEQVVAWRKFAELSQPQCERHQLKARALAIADSFDPFLHAIETLLTAARRVAGR